MITRQPKIGETIEYKSGGHWQYAGKIVAIIGNLAYCYDETLPENAHKKYFGLSPIPKGCETANSGFIWSFHDGLNKLHRIKE